MINQTLINQYLISLFLFSLASVAQAKPQITKDMVHLDQAYIPVLAFTSAKDVNASRASFKAFEKAWHTFKGKYYSHADKDPLWKFDFNKIDKYVRASKEIISRGDNLKAAHEDLEHVRVIMMHLRERNGIDYYIDHLTRFHEPMEKIVLAVKGKTVATLPVNALILIKKILPEAMQRWHSVAKSKLDASLYEFSKPKTKMLLALVKMEYTALARLQHAVKANDKAQIILAGLAIKPNFAKLFKAFGHFQKQK